MVQTHFVDTSLHGDGDPCLTVSQTDLCIDHV